ncbi:MAG: PAS domain-containing protein [Phycisphaerae bacterium]|nr:PAS domain-containing protein [Phycisphaerae bacterium]
MIIIKRTINTPILIAGLCVLLTIIGTIADWPLSVNNSSMLSWSLLIVAMILSVMYWRDRAIRFSIPTSHIENQLLQFAREGRIGMIMVDTDDELSELVAAFNNYLTDIGFCHKNLVTQNKELKIQADVTEIERCHIEAAINSIPEAVLVIDENDELVMANPVAQGLFEFNMEFNFRRMINEVLANEPDLLELIKYVRSSGRNDVIRQIHRKHPITDQELILEIKIGSVKDLAKKPMGVVVVIHDLTKEKELARMQDEFVSGVSHELKTPLSSIRAYVEMLYDGEADNHGKFCQVIESQTKKLELLIDEILNFSSIESQAYKINYETINIGELIADIKTIVMPQVCQKNISLQSAISPAICEFEADREMLIQAILNLVSNAVKYCHENGNINLDVRQKENELLIEVQDDGPGIPQACISQVFDRFYRVPAHKDLAGGTGLGLSLARQIVENVHGGRLTVASQENQGCTFCIAIPMATQQVKLTEDM